MNITPFAHVVALCSILVCFSPAGFAQQRSSKVPVEVTNVKFASAKVGSMLPMNRMEVEVRALANAKVLEDPNAVVPNKDWVDKIKVTVTTAYELPVARKSNVGVENKYTFYRASATIMTMEKNSKGSVYFYLPGEIVKRDRLKTEPYAYMVEVEVDGKVLEPTKVTLSKNLHNADEYKAFKDLGDRGVMENAGVLRPQYQVPYEAMQAFSPTLIREDTTRQ